MKLTLSWLKEYLDTKADLAEICRKLTDIGLEVEEIEDKAKSLAPFTVAQIITASPHPNSNKLQICNVSVGNGNNLQIICGAKNARAGLKVAYAPIDSIIPANGMKIKKSKILGVESHGMLCSANELGLGSDGEGIIEIDEKFAIGTKISEVFGLNEAVLTINITPNRGDCLGIYGIARDLSASGIGTLKSPNIQPVSSHFSSPIKIEINDDNCPYFSGRYIKNINNCESPKWLKEKLEAIGINVISAVVDISNYVMFCLNQPLHCYDADKINGNITVKKSKDNENFTSLQNLEYKLSGEELVITDQNKSISLAGIIGSLDSSSTPNTKNIFLEAAFFNPQIIAKAGRKLNILSDARYRFERGIDLSSVNAALDMASNLILEICGGEASEITSAGNCQINPAKINFGLNKVSKILGSEISQDEISKILANLGFGLKEINNETLEVIVPPFRSDVTISEDLVEEIIRIYGYDKIKPIPLSSSNILQYQNIFDQVRTVLCLSGIQEIISWSFISSKIAPLFSNINPALLISNPISKDMDYMRASLIPGLVFAAKKNKLRGFENLAFFEIGKIFLGINPEEQKNIISAIRIGKNQERSSYKEERFFDIMDVKKDFFDCLQLFGISAKSVQISHDAPNYYHGHRSATVKLGKNIIGYFGELSPIINKKLDINGRINAFEIFADNLPNPKKPSSKKPFIVSDFQSVNRDFAFILDEKIKIGEVIKAVENCDKELISKVNIFDIYQGDKIAGGKKSVAFEVEIQPVLKTLTSEEIEQISNKIISTVTTNFGGILRGN